MSQTSAPSVNMEAGFAGLIAESFGPRKVESMYSDAVQKFGYGVALDAATKKVKTPGAATDVTANFAGIVASSHALESSESGDPQYAAKASLPVLRRGVIWVKVEDAVTINGDVYCNWQNGAEGQFRSDGDAGNAALVPSAKYRSSAGAGELALVEINLP